MAPKSIPVVLNCGDYIPSGGFFEEVGRRKALALFLDAVRRECPGTLAKLESLVLPVFRRAVKVCSEEVRKGLRLMADPHGIRRIEFLDQLMQRPKSHPVLNELNESLRIWGAEFNLVGLPIAMDVALGTVAAWAIKPKKVSVETWLVLPTPEPGANAAIPWFGTEGWDPRFERRKDAADRILKAAKEYLRAVETAVKVRGWKKAPVKRFLQHFEWLAQFQVGGKPVPNIGTADERTTIAQGIEAAGKLVAGKEWRHWRREVPKGRPK